MKQGFADKRFVSVLAIAFLIILLTGLFYMFWYRPALSESKTLLAESNEKLKFLQATESIVKNKRDEVKNSAGNETANKKVVPESLEQEGILRDLETARQASGAVIKEISFGTDAAGGESATGTSAAEDLAASGKPAEMALSLALSGMMDRANLLAVGLSPVRAEVRLSASLPQAKQFAASLQQAERLYVVQSFSFGEGNEGLEKAVSISISTFYRAPNNP